MERNTITKLGELQVGDSFTYTKRVDPWRVVANDGKKVKVNQFLPWGDKNHYFDEEKSPKIQVRFLKHAETTEAKL
ncbi:MAG: hypothetical protein EOO10_21910 [Chitinophagaceae bacterium]|nr:MAG: hypothetical protein EOO10_21910 [Chitinophagaceae bacterium]